MHLIGSLELDDFALDGGDELLIPPASSSARFA